VFNLPHDVMCGKDQCGCKTHVHRQMDRNKETGEVGFRDLERKLSGSVHLQPGAKATLPDAAERAPEIVSARARGDVQVNKLSTPAAAA